MGFDVRNKWGVFHEKGANVGFLTLYSIYDSQEYENGDDSGLVIQFQSDEIDIETAFEISKFLNKSYDFKSFIDS